MSDDMMIIRKIENQLGIKLKKRPVDKIMQYGKHGYSIDKWGKVNGLNLNGTTIRYLSVLKNLEDLKYLSLNSCHLTDLTPLKGLTKLIKLGLNNNHLVDLTPLKNLTKLTELYLDDNHLTDLMPLEKLTKLTELYLGDNHLTDLMPLKELKALKVFDARNNRIEKLPPDITTLWAGMKMNWESQFTHGLILYGNPLTDPPIEIVRQGKKAIQNYLDEIKRASVLFLESKLLLVGSGDVGKTTVMKKLKDNNFVVVPGKEDTTRGIDIQTWNLSCSFDDGQAREVKIHFWDFGGQDILHATHQFFLTKRSLYLFIWDPRKEEETRSFDYWLNAVKLFGAESPLIMVMNKSDIRIKYIDEASFKEKFPNIERFLQVSCVSGQNMNELTEAIRTALCGMPHLLDKLPKRWKDIRDELKTRTGNYISLEDYLTICSSHCMENEKALFLSDYLHDLGIILHFRMDPVLADTVILKPEWATGAVYALIDSLEIQQNKGRFSRVDLSEYWRADVYPPEKHSQLLRLMEKFELCFNIMGTDDYIIPELLPTQRPSIDMEIYRSNNNLHLHYTYDFMPAGIITRFICRLHYLIRDNHYWNNGVELEFSSSSALVMSDSAQKRIRISVSGNNNTQLMGVIRSHFDHIHETLNMKKEKHVFEEVPCNCPECSQSNDPYFYKYNVLQRLLTINRNAFCEKSFKEVSTHQLLNGLLPPKDPGNLFDTLITTLSQVQTLKKTFKEDENTRNTVVANFLKARGVRAVAQTFAGISESGSGIGELDIKIESENGRDQSIIEGLKLGYRNTNQINRHIKKLFDNYDCSGLKENYLLVYSTGNFEELCRNYQEYIQDMDYGSYTLYGDIEIPDTGFNKITAFRARHKYNNNETVLYHILVEM
ncbi:MAG: COR domain-containing protein [Candidatus Omnitrophota bacterium]